MPTKHARPARVRFEALPAYIVPGSTALVMLDNPLIYPPSTVAEVDPTSLTKGVELFIAGVRMLWPHRSFLVDTRLALSGERVPPWLPEALRSPSYETARRGGLIPLSSAPEREELASWWADPNRNAPLDAKAGTSVERAYALAILERLDRLQQKQAS